MEDRVETSNLQIHSFSSSLQSCMWAWKTLHPRKRPPSFAKKKNAKMTVETVETVVAAAPYSALIGHKLRPLLSDSQSALAECEEDVIQICHLLSRNGKLSLVRLTKSFPTIPNLRGIANAYQNDKRFKMWSVMLLCTILPWLQRTAVTPVGFACTGAISRVIVKVTSSSDLEKIRVRSKSTRRQAGRFQRRGLLRTLNKQFWER